jgi:cytochrome c oxidase subunit II
VDSATGPAPKVPAPGRVRPRKWSRKWVVLGVVPIAIALAGCQVPNFGAYRGATTQGQAAFKLWQFFFIAGIAIGGLVAALILWSVVRYRRKTTDIPPQHQYHTLFELFYTIVPVLLVLVLFAFTFITENEITSVAATAQVKINVTAFQWGWSFNYPTYHVTVQGVETQDPEMVVPVGETVRIFLRSADVVHGFYVPEFNFSRYAQPGVTNSFDLNVLHPGVYRGQCTQLCGLYHSLMFFRVKAVSPRQFQIWAQTSSPAGSPINNLRQRARAGAYA